MRAEEALQKWHGLCIPVPTIYGNNAARDLDLEALQGHIRFLLDEGASGDNSILLVGGAAGDFPLLSVEERKQLSTAAVEAVEGQVAILISAQSTDLRVTLELARHADSIGIDGIQVSPPYYEEPPDGDVRRWFQAISQAVERVGLVVYNTWWQGYDLSLDFVAELAELEHVVGLKWSTPEIHRTIEGYRRFGKQLAIIDNTVFPVHGHVLGSVGYVTHTVNFWPRYEWDIWAAMQQRDYTAANARLDQVHEAMTAFTEAVTARVGPDGNRIKLAMELMGRGGGPARAPQRTIELSAQHRRELEALIEELAARLYEGV